jgi:hypothetical protein
MPTLAQKNRVAEIRKYFKERFAARVERPIEAKAELVTRFGINSKSEWYRFVPEFKKMIAEAREGGGNGELVAEELPQEDQPTQEQAEDELVEIPADLAPSAKTLVNSLLSKNAELAAVIQGRDAEISAQRGQIIVQARKLTLLKKLVYDAVEAI